MSADELNVLQNSLAKMVAEVGERLARIETTLDVMVTSERMAKVEADTKSAHRRIGELEEFHASSKKSMYEALEKTEKRIFWVAGVIFIVVQVIVNFFMRQ